MTKAKNYSADWEKFFENEARRYGIYKEQVRVL